MQNIGIIFALDGILNYEKLKQFNGFKYSRLTNQEEHQELTPPITKTNCHFLKLGRYASEKTSFLKHYLDQTKSDYIGFGHDANEFHDNRFVQILQLEQIKTETLANKTIFLDDAGGYKNLKTKVEDLFRFGRHHNIQEIYLAQYAKDILPAVRETCS